MLPVRGAGRDQQRSGPGNRSCPCLPSRLCLSPRSPRGLPAGCPGGTRYCSVVLPLSYRCATVVLPLFYWSRCGFLAALRLRREALPGRDDGAGLLRIVFPTIHFLPGLHSVMSVQLVAGRADGLVAVACAADKACQSDSASLNSSRQPND